VSQPPPFPQPTMTPFPPDPVPTVSPERSLGPHAPNLRPRKGLFIVLSVLMLVWIIAMVVMYFTTVWPMRHSPSHLPLEHDVNDHPPTTMNG
jgi:hypothetical protein